MNLKKIFAIVRKDLLEVRQNKAAWMPMLILPLLLMVVLPLAMILIPPSVGLTMDQLTSEFDLGLFLDRMPPSVSTTLQGYDPLQTILVIVLGYFFAPMFLILPLMFSTIIAAESFAGERERKTMEALLYTSASDRELFLGKVLAALVPALAISWLSFLVYTLVLNLAGFGSFHRIWFPLPSWWPLIFWITPALAVLGISTTVLISARTQTFMGAYQASGSLVILVLGLMAGQVSGVLYLSVIGGLLVGLGFWLAAILLTNFAIRSFQRTRLLVSAQ
jgi:ABC-2 type transport system permease protein